MYPLRSAFCSAYSIWDAIQVSSQDANITPSKALREEKLIALKVELNILDIPRRLSELQELVQLFRHVGFIACVVSNYIFKMNK